MKEDGIHTPLTKSLLQSHIANLNTPKIGEIFVILPFPDQCFWNGKPYFEINVINKLGKTRAEVTLHGALMNSLARKTFPLEHSRQLSQLGYYEQVCLCATQAWDRLTPPSGSQDPASSLLSLQQKPGEPLSDFILRTKMSLERKIPNPTARDLLLKTIVWEGMTSESRLACQGLREEHHDRGNQRYRNRITSGYICGSGICSSSKNRRNLLQMWRGRTLEG